jgi:hypothetical protein
VKSVQKRILELEKVNKKIEEEREHRTKLIELNKMDSKSRNEDEKPRFHVQNKPQLPNFSSKSPPNLTKNMQSSTKERLQIYEEYKNRSQIIKQEYQQSIREKQLKAEIALKQWKKLKFNKFKRSSTEEKRN